MLGVDEVLSWVLDVDVLGVKCLLLGVDEVLEGQKLQYYIGLIGLIGLIRLIALKG